MRWLPYALLCSNFLASADFFECFNFDKREPLPAKKEAAKISAIE